METSKVRGFSSQNKTQDLISDYKPVVSVDGEGFRCSLYVSGCLFACKNCFNKSIQDFGVGKPYTDELEEQIIKDLAPNHIQGFTLLGGEPMLNTNVSLKITNRIRSEYKNEKDIWCWTGYTWEELLESISCNTRNSKQQNELLMNVDVLVDGQYIDELKDGTGLLKFRGSSNQRIIDVRESIRLGRLIEIERYKFQKEN